MEERDFEKLMVKDKPKSGRKGSRGGRGGHGGTLDTVRENERKRF